jgi:hypothetical protein
MIILWCSILIILEYFENIAVKLFLLSLPLKRKCMTTTEREWCEKVVYWKMMRFHHSFHLSLLNDQIIFLVWWDKMGRQTITVGLYWIHVWHVKMLVSEMICRCRPVFHHLWFSMFLKNHLSIIGPSRNRIFQSLLFIMSIHIKNRLAQSCPWIHLLSFLL